MVSRFDRFINTFLTDSADGADKKPRRHRTVEPVGVGLLKIPTTSGNTPGSMNIQL